MLTTAPCLRTDLSLPAGARDRDAERRFCWYNSLWATMFLAGPVIPVLRSLFSAGPPAEAPFPKTDIG